MHVLLEHLKTLQEVTYLIIEVGNAYVSILHVSAPALHATDPSAKAIFLHGTTVLQLLLCIGIIEIPRISLLLTEGHYIDYTVA